MNASSFPGRCSPRCGVLFLCAAVFSTVVCVASSGSILKHAESFDAALAQGRAANKPILLEFFAPW